MQRNRSRLALLGVLALALSVTAGLTVSDLAAAAKKKKSKSGGTVDITKVVGAAIPDATATTDGVLTSTIDVGGKKFRGTRIRDVNVTVQTTGTGAGSVGDLEAFVTAPNGATSWLFAFLVGGGPIFGPLTFDDETPNNLQAGAPPARDATSVAAPFQGTAQPYCFFALGNCALSSMDNGPASGTWTLRVFDQGTGAGNTSVLNQWRLNVVAGKAFLTK